MAVGRGRILQTTIERMAPSIRVERRLASASSGQRSHAFLARHQGDRAAQRAVTTQRFDDVGGPSCDQSFHRVDPKELIVVRESIGPIANWKSSVGRPSVIRSWARLSICGPVVDAEQNGNTEGLQSRSEADRGNGDLGSREGREERARPERLKLNELPVPLREKTQESVVRPRSCVSRLRSPNTTPRGSFVSRIDAIREERGSRSGTDGGVPIINPVKPDRGSVAGGKDSSGPSAVDEIRQKKEDRRSARDQRSQWTSGSSVRHCRRGRATRRERSSRCPAGRTPQAGRCSSAARENSTVIENGVPRNMDRGSAGEGNPERSSGPSPAQIRAQELRQQSEIRRQEREVQREAPAPINRTPIERAPVERAPRQIERAPVERMPIERAPIERAPGRTSPASD